jgi:hypothetical protein
MSSSIIHRQAIMQASIGICTIAKTLIEIPRDSIVDMQIDEIEVAKFRNNLMFRWQKHGLEFDTL